MNITILGQARNGSRTYMLSNALSALGHDVTVVDTDSLTRQFLTDRFPGFDYHAHENLGKPMPLSWLLPDNTEAVLIIQHYLHFTNDVHPRIVVAHWFTEPYFAPSCRECPVLLVPDANTEGNMLQWYKWEYMQNTCAQFEFPCACPTLPETDAARVNKGLNFLANVDFGYKLNRVSYLESQALRERKRFMQFALRMNELTVHQYPKPWTEYIQILQQSQFMLVVPGNGCTVNQQLCECLACGTIPVLFVENAESIAAFKQYGLVHGENCIQFDDETTLIDALGIMHQWMRNPTVYNDRSAKCKALAKRHSYELRAKQLVGAFEKGRLAIQNIQSLEVETTRQTTA